MGAIEEAFHGLRRMIASGELGPGQRLPPEAQLCDRLKVSRGSLREAVRMLGALGVIESRHGSGTYVSGLEAADLLGALRLTVELMPLEVFVELYEVRRVLEAHAAAQAASRITDAQVAELTAMLDELETLRGEQGTELDARFHQAISTIGGNSALVTLLDVVRARSRSYRFFELTGEVDLKRASDREHRAILSALANRDPGSASVAAAAHVSSTEAWLRTFSPPPVPPED